jgi:hypothetical protein
MNPLFLILLQMENQKIETIEVIETKMLYLSTKSSSGTLLNGDMKSHVVYDLRSYINFDGDRSVKKITVSMPYALLVNSNYIINQNNSRLSILVGATQTDYDFPYGNYGASSFMTVFSNIVSGYSISLDQVTNKFTISNPINAFTILGTSTIDYIMGFSDNVVSTLVSGINKATMPRVCNYLPNASFQICTIGGVLYNGVVLGSGGNSYGNVLCSIPNVSTNNTQLVYNGTAEEFQLQGLNQSYLELAIFDNNGDYIDFNGIASFFSLKIKVYRQIERLVGTFSDFLKMPIYEPTPLANTSE